MLSLENVSWAISRMWAIDACHRHGRYYLVFCAIEAAAGMFRTGVAVSDLPKGPLCTGIRAGTTWNRRTDAHSDDC